MFSTCVRIAANYHWNLTFINIIVGNISHIFPISNIIHGKLEKNGFEM